MDLVSRLTHTLDGALDIKSHLWRFELMENQTWLEEATTAASKANLMIISSWSDQKLPSAVRQLMQSSVTSARKNEIAVVGLLGPDGHLDGLDSKNFQYIFQATRRAGIDFFAPQLRFRSPVKFEGHVFDLDVTSFTAARATSNAFV